MSEPNKKSEQSILQSLTLESLSSCLTLFAIYTAIVICFLILYWIIYFFDVVERSIYNWIVLGLTIFSVGAFITIVLYRRKKNKEPNRWIDNKSVNAIDGVDDPNNIANTLSEIPNANNPEEVDKIMRGVGQVKQD
jgi:type VI protein secretion system component VasK